MTGRRALICGVSGQDGAYLARLLLEKGYRVIGATRGETNPPPDNLVRLNVDKDVQLESLDAANAEAVTAAVRAIQPEEIYYLAAQSSVSRSFQDPAGTLAASAVGLANVLAAAAAAPHTRVVNAASGDCFGETSAVAPATESSPFRPRSPYAAAKCAAHHLISAARISHELFACSAFLFNHESPLRPETFAVGKVVAAAKRIARGSGEEVELGNVEVVRDWGWAPEYVEAMWRMLQQAAPQDFVIATGRSHSLAELVALCFAQAGLDWRAHVRVNKAPPRLSDIAVHHADPSLARERLGWKTRVGIDELARNLMAG